MLKQNQLLIKDLKSYWKKAIKGASYRGGKVIKADGIINDFILEFK